MNNDVEGNSLTPQRKRILPLKLLKAGYYSGLIGFFICLLLSLLSISYFLYLTYFWINSLDISQISSQTEVFINARLVMGRIALLSCGVLAGLSFGFLGFSLFLIGIEGSIDANVESVDYKATLSRISPGAIVIIAASILIGVCATRETPFWYERTIDNQTAPLLKKDSSDESTDVEQKRDLPPKIKLEKP